MSEEQTNAPIVVAEPPAGKPAGRAKGDTKEEQARRKRARAKVALESAGRHARVKAGMAVIEERRAKGELVFQHTNVPDTVDELIDRMTNEAAYRPDTRVLYGVMDLNGPLADTAIDAPTVEGGLTAEADVPIEPVAAGEGDGGTVPEMAVTPSADHAPERVVPATEPDPRPTTSERPSPDKPSTMPSVAPRTAGWGRACLLTAALVGAAWVGSLTQQTAEVAVLDAERVKAAVLDRAKTESLDATYRALDAFDAVLHDVVTELLHNERLVLLRPEAVIGRSGDATDVTPRVTRRVLERLSAPARPDTGKEAP